MIYLVSRNKSLFRSEDYTEIDLNQALDILKPLKLVQFDTETEGLDPWTKKLLTIQLGNKDNQVVIDWTTISVDEKHKIKEYLESDIILLGWNLVFDLGFCYVNDIWPKHVWDGMIADQLIFLGMPRNLTTDQYDNQFGYEPIEDERGILKHYELSYSLKAAAKRWCNIDIDKSVRGKINQVGLTPEVIIYAANDVRWLEDIKNEQEKEIARQDLSKAVEFECEFIKPTAYIKHCGVHLDKSKWQAKMDKDLANKEQALKELNDYVVNLDKQEWVYRTCTNQHDIEKAKSLHFEQDYDKSIGKEEVWKYHIKGKFTKTDLQGDLWSGFNTEPQCIINWDSSQQVIPLFEILGIQTHTFDKKTKKEKKSIEEKQIAPQKDKFPIIEIFLRYQGAAKVVSTYGDNWLKAINPVTGRIHAEVHSIGTDTSRMSSGGGPYKLNQQNLPHDPATRACFTAEKGNRWISCDYSGQESAITASVSQDSKMIEILSTGGDLHSTVAKMCWPKIIGDTPIKEIKHKFKAIRQNAKGAEFGIFYGGDYNTLHANKGLPLDEAKEVYNNFMKGFPGVKQYQDYCRAAVMQKGYILMNPIFKHRAHIYDSNWLKFMQNKFKDHDFWQYYREMKESSPYCDTVMDVKKYFKRKSDCERQSINYRIQNRGACAFKLATIKFFNWLVSHNYQNVIKICVVAHDEINLEAPEEMAEDVAQLLMQCMIAGGKPFCPNVFLGADVARTNKHIKEFKVDNELLASVGDFSEVISNEFYNITTGKRHQLTKAQSKEYEDCVKDDGILPTHWVH